MGRNWRGEDGQTRGTPWGAAVLDTQREEGSAWWVRDGEVGPARAEEVSLKEGQPWAAE